MTRSTFAALSRPGPASRPSVGRSSRLPRPLLIAAVAGLSLAVSTLSIGVIEQLAHATYAAPLYLLAVLAVGTLFGMVPAVLTSVAAFLLYDFLFVRPLYTFTIASADEWLNLILLLVVSVVVGRLVSLLAARAEEAEARATEARTLFELSGALATGRSVGEVGDVVLRRLAEATAMDRAWLGIGPTPGEETVVADSGGEEPRPEPGLQVVLQRSPSGEPNRWTRLHVSAAPDRRSRRPTTVHRVKVAVPGEVLGSLWALRAAGAPDPDRVETWILAAAADQLAQAVVRDRLIEEGTRAEVARQSDALKSALLDSVSHDLRTPLATIRAAAGSLLDRSVEWSQDEEAETLRTIDGQAERMNRLVRNLLDMSRIEGGALRPELEAHDLDELVEAAVDGCASGMATRIEADVPAGLPPVLVDEVYFGQIASNLLENAARHGGDHIRVRCARAGGGWVDFVVEDDGPGVPEGSRSRLFEKFYRGPSGRASRAGMGIGLTVVAGLTRAMGGDVEARASELGGLAIVVRLRIAPVSSDEGVTPKTTTALSAGSEALR